MLRKVNISPNQKVTAQDFNNFGAFPRESLDATIKDFGGFPTIRYTGLTVEQAGQSTVRVGVGRVYLADGSGYLFDDDGGQTIDLLDNLPAVAKRVATIVAYGSTVDTDLEPRTFLIDAETRATQGQEVATESRRQAYISFLLGAENATPTAPAVPSNYVAVANVVLTPAGIESITQLTENKVVSNYALYQKVVEFDLRFAQVGPQIDTLKTDISALAKRINGKADSSFVNQIAIDVARIKDKVDLPDNYASYAADLYLDSSHSDPAFAGYNARVNEGVRFPPAGSAYTFVALANPLEPRVVVNDNMALPTWTSLVRSSVVGRDSEYPLTNTSVENVTIRQVNETRTVVKMLGSERYCTNAAWWASGQYDPITGIFKRNGETYIIVSEPGQKPDRNAPLGPNGIHLTHYIYAQKYVEQTIIDTHFEQVSTTENIAGSIAAQVVLNTQDGYMSAVNLFFTKKASSGSVRVMICDVDDSARPLLSRVLAQATIAVGDINIYPLPTQAAFKPVFMPKGSRYAIVLISSNAHFIAQVGGNKFAQGQIMYLSGGVWTPGLSDVDMAFETKFLHFDSPIVTVDLAPLELAGGIDSIQINADCSKPDGTRIEFEVRVAGVWRSLKEAANGTNILATRPSLVQFRAVFIGTTDVMPALGLTAARSEILLTRPASTGLLHVSQPRIPGITALTIKVTVRLENWVAGQHTLTMTLLTGVSYATVETADVTTDQVAPDDPNALIRECAFLVSPGITQFRIKMVGSIGAATEYFHVAERVDIEFTT